MKRSAILFFLVALTACESTESASIIIPANFGGGSGFRNEFVRNPDLVTPDGTVMVRPDEVLVQPDPGQPGAPPGIGTPDPAQENEVPPMEGTPDTEGAPEPVRE